jgi:hypothetical protein
VIQLSGTLESSGPNKGGITSAPAKDWGYSGRGGKSTASPPLRGSVESNGINKTGDMGSKLTSAVDINTDVTMYPCPEGTLEDGGLNG